MGSVLIVLGFFGLVAYLATLFVNNRKREKNETANSGSDSPNKSA